MIEEVGKPVFHRYTQDLYGSWMVDASPPEGEGDEKLWVVRSEQKAILYQFNNRSQFRHDLHARSYRLPFPCTVRGKKAQEFS